MIRFTLNRLAFVIPQLLIVVIGTFLLLRVLPVDPVSHVVGFLGTRQAYLQAQHQLGLDHSIGNQLVTFLQNLVTLDFGHSWASNRAVTTEIAQKFPVTLQLIFMGFLLALAIALPLGYAMAAKPGGRAERATTIYALFAGAQPDFWWGLMFIYFFFYKLNWFPAPLGLVDPTLVPPEGPTHFLLVDSLLHGDYNVFVSALKHYALPVATLAFVLTGPILKIMRQASLDVLSSDYVLYAKAVGQPPRAIRRMTMRNALAPVLTITGILFGYSLGGAVLIETVFSLNGLGRYALDSTLNLDFPAVQGVVVVMTTFSLLIYLVMDILYAALDPRVRYS